MTPSDHVSNTDYHAWLNDQAPTKPNQTKPKKEMKIADVYSDKNAWLSSKDIGNKEIVVTIKGDGMHVFPEDDASDEKFCLYFHETEKGLTVNKTNWSRLKHLLGGEQTEEWRGRKIILIVEPCISHGQQSQGIRVKMQLPEQAPASNQGGGFNNQQAQPAPANTAANLLEKDDIIF